MEDFLLYSRCEIFVVCLSKSFVEQLETFCQDPHGIKRHKADQPTNPVHSNTIAFVYVALTELADVWGCAQQRYLPVFDELQNSFIEKFPPGTIVSRAVVDNLNGLLLHNCQRIMVWVTEFRDCSNYTRVYVAHP